MLWVTIHRNTGREPAGHNKNWNSIPRIRNSKPDRDLVSWNTVTLQTIWLFHAHPSAFWARTVICIRSYYVNTSMHRTMRPSEHLHARSNTCFLVLEAHTERVCWWENENVTETEGLSENPDGNQRCGGSGVEPPFSISAGWVQTIAIQRRPFTGAGIFKSDGES